MTWGQSSVKALRQRYNGRLILDDLADTKTTTSRREATVTDTETTLCRIHRHLKTEWDAREMQGLWQVGEASIKLTLPGGVGHRFTPDSDLGERVGCDGPDEACGVVDFRIRDALAALALDWRDVAHQVIRWSTVLTVQAWGQMEPKRLLRAIGYTREPGDPPDYEGEDPSSTPMLDVPTIVQNCFKRSEREGRVLRSTYQHSLSNAGGRAIRKRARDHTERWKP